MKKSPLPFKKMLFVCTNARKPGERISCAGENRCGEQILNSLREYVKRNKLQEFIRVAKSGCQERCEQGPNIMLMPQNEFISNISPEDIEELTKTYLRC